MASEIDRALLRRFEPVIHFTKGEQFFPMDVKPYVLASGLWAQEPDRPPARLVGEGELSLEQLGAQSANIPGARHYLQFIESVNITDMAVSHLPWKREAEDERFEAGHGRLARVGYVSRFADALFSLSLLARGRVPGDSAAAANGIYKQMMAEDECYCYHGRVIREGHWIVLQYWFFYAYNNWRTRFFGANDHEADWEMVCLYLAEQPTRAVMGMDKDEAEDEDDNDPLSIYEPEWIAYASHDYQGDDLRRRWDDPEVQKEGTHPVIFTGAGSHASYFSAGEYLTELELPILAPLARASSALNRFWRKQLRQYTADGGQSQGSGDSIFHIPFVDYARGDGFSLGPSQPREWDEPRILTPVPTWVSGYRGLWGLYTQDPFSGEDAPAGPMYNRDGTVRKAWYDPVGWAGLEKVPPFTEAAQITAEQVTKLRRRQNELREEVQRAEDELVGVGAEYEATRNLHHLAALHQGFGEELTALSQQSDDLRAEIATNQTMLDALEDYRHQLVIGQRGSARAHITRAHEPAPPARKRQNWIFELWAAASIGLAMLIVVALAYFAPQHLAIGLVIIIAIFTFIEAGFRGRLPRLVTSVTIALAVVSLLVLLSQFFWEVVVIVVLITGAYLLFENLREIW